LGNTRKTNSILNILSRFGLYRKGFVQRLEYIGNETKRAGLLVRMAYQLVKRERFKHFWSYVSELPVKLQSPLVIRVIIRLSMGKPKNKRIALSSNMIRFYHNCWEYLDSEFKRGKVKEESLAFLLRHIRFFDDHLYHSTRLKYFQQHITQPMQRKAVEISILIYEKKRKKQNNTRFIAKYKVFTRLKDSPMKAYLLLMLAAPDAIGPEWERAWQKFPL
jgi:hypothetical protein